MKQPQNLPSNVYKPKPLFASGGRDRCNEESISRLNNKTITLHLGKGIMLHINSIPYAFTLPHRYHERIQHKILTDYPDSRTLLDRRIGYLGAATPVRYSLFAYLEQAKDCEVKVAGAALNSVEAWAFNALIPLKDLGIGIAKTLEHIAALPIHNPVEFSHAARSRPETFCAGD